MSVGVGAVVAVVAAGGEGDIREGEDFLHLRLLVGGLRDADVPGLGVGVASLCDDFAADFHHVVLHAVAFEEPCHAIDGVAFCNGSAVEHDALSSEVSLIAYGAEEGVDLLVGGSRGVVLAESPCVDEGCHGDVEGSLGVLADAHGEGDDFFGEGVGGGVLPGVVVGEPAVGVEEGECVVHALHLGFDLRGVVGGALVCDVVGGAEDGAVVGDIGRGVAPQYPDGGYGEEQEEEEEDPIEDNITNVFDKENIIIENNIIFCPDMKQIEIYDLSGRLLYKDNIHGTFDLSKFAERKQIILNIKSEDKVIRKKLSIN